MVLTRVCCRIQHKGDGITWTRKLLWSRSNCGRQSSGCLPLLIIWFGPVHTLKFLRARHPWDQIPQACRFTLQHTHTLPLMVLLPRSDIYPIPPKFVPEFYEGVTITQYFQVAVLTFLVYDTGASSFKLISRGISQQACAHIAMTMDKEVRLCSSIYIGQILIRLSQVKYFWVRR